jgi:adenine-specific DNA-methyltransferase
MSDVSQFRTVGAWRTALGLLPVPLRATAESHGQYVLMNGTVGNFCLDFGGRINTKAQRAAIAWSCDVGHYITFAEDFVVVNRWGKEPQEEKFTCRSVFEQLHTFHRYLEKTTPDRSRSIIAHVLRVYRRIRTVENEGVTSLRVLLYLIASAASGQNRLDEAQLGLWGLVPETVSLSHSITEATWRPLYNDLAGIGRYDVLHPDLELLIRHASGSVFQDAHLEANSSLNLWFDGFEGPATVGPDAAPSEVGVYFTPPALARTLAEESTSSIDNTSDSPLSIFDPACGSGELLKECLRLLKVNQHCGPVRVLGWDKSEAAVDMARFVLAWEKRAWPAGRVEVDVRHQDSIAATTWPDGVDILLMNPPFKSWNLMETAEQDVAKHFLGASYKPNLAMVFAYRALKALGDKGTLAMITPNSILEGSSGKYVREQFAELLSPKLIARLGDQTIFARALVDAGMYVGMRHPTVASATAVLWADSNPTSLNHALRGLRKWRSAEVEPISDDGFSVYRRDDIGKSGGPWVARGYDAWRSYERMHRNKRTLPARKIFDIKQGVRLGNDAFIVTEEYFYGLPNSERQFFRPAVMNLSISDARLNDSYYVFYPQTLGLPAIITEQDLRDHVPTYFQERLLPAQDKLAARKTLARASQSWWELLEHRVWLEKPRSKIVSKYFGGIRSFAFDRTGEFVVVVGNAWLLEKGALQLAITEEEVYLAVLAYLSSSTADGLLKYVSVQVAGGQSDLSRRYVGGLPIPDLAKLKPDELSNLVQMGTAISNGAVDQWSSVDDLILSILGR